MRRLRRDGLRLRQFHRSSRTYLAVGALTAVVVAAAPGTRAQGAAPCPPGSEMPTITAEDFEAGSGATLTATHDIDVDARFSNGLGARDSFQFSAPAGVTLRSQGPTGTRLVSDAAGAIPLTVSWTELRSDGPDCTASTSTTLQLQAPTPLTFAKLPAALRKLGKKSIGRYSAGWSVTQAVGRYTDLRPVEIRLRGTARARLPGPTTPFKTATLPLRGGAGKQRVLRSSRWRVTGYVSFRRPPTLSLDSRLDTHSHRYHALGYELQVLQGGRLMLRVRAAGRCIGGLFGEAGSCKWHTVKVERRT